jgi:hypothetical protein
MASPPASHPKISYANAAPTGAGMKRSTWRSGSWSDRPRPIGRAIDRSLPTGFDIVDAVRVGQRFRLPTGGFRLATGTSVPAAAGVAAVEALLAQETVTVQRMTKKGCAVRYSSGAGCRAMHARRRRVCDTDPVVGAAPPVRPDDVLGACSSGRSGAAGTSPGNPAGAGPLAAVSFSDRPVCARSRGGGPEWGQRPQSDRQLA